MGYRDQSVEQGLTTVKFEVNIQSVPSELTPAQPFDVYVLAQSTDYECYVRSVTMLDQRMGLDCSFLNDPLITYENIYNFSSQLPSFINLTNQYTEYFFVIDNTDFPLFNNSGPVARSLRQFVSNDLIVDVTFTTTYDITEEYSTYIYVGGAVFIALIALLIVLIFMYKRHLNIYSSMANKRMMSEPNKQHEGAEELDRTSS